VGILSRIVLLEVLSAALLGTGMFTFVLFLQRLSANKLFELLVRSSSNWQTAAYLFSLVLPPALTFSIPVGVLVGVLIGLSRMSSDGEITAMRAAGVPSRKVLLPVVFLALAGTVCTAACSLWLTPLSVRETYRVFNQLLATQMTAEIRPRVFEEQFANNNTILFVGDVIAGPVVRWRNIFIADTTPPESRARGAREAGDAPRLTIASEAIAMSDVARNRIQLHLIRGATHEVGKEPGEYLITSFPIGDQVLEAERPAEVRAKAYVEMETGPLWAEAARSIDAAIELNQRLALPPACLLLALVGVPLGVSTRKAGKSAAIVMTVALAFFYYMGLISLIGLARQGTLPVAIAVWTPNILLAIFGVFFLVRLEAPGDRDVVSYVTGLVRYWVARLRGRLPKGASPIPFEVRLRGFRILPQLIDTYILSSFLFYFALLLASFVLMTEVYNFFELLGDMVRNQIAMSRMFTYLFFLTPKLIYDLTPVSVLVAVLVTFGILAKQNEVTAMKACGVSLYRLALPVLFASGLLSLMLFAFDHYYVPEANIKQDAIRNEIKGRAVQTWLRPDRKWIFGRGSRIYYYKYFDPVESVMVGVSVYELDPRTFRLHRHISAELARWEPALHSWVFQNGWMRDIDGIRVTDFRTFQATVFQELDEPPNYFLKEVKQDKQMNFQHLAAYILELQQSGFDTVRLQVQYHRKFSVPMFAFIMALISIPFAFLTGSRGAMAGVGVSLGIAVTYWAVSQLFEQVGNLNQLPAMLAAWSPASLFCLAGVYLLARMRT
jgi:LPS export ABC transporter permease LptG